MKGTRLTASMMAMALGAGALNAADKSMQPIASDPVETSSGRVAGTALASGVRHIWACLCRAAHRRPALGPAPARPLDRHIQRRPQRPGLHSSATPA
jgi:hypothetical protein